MTDDNFLPIERPKPFLEIGTANLLTKALAKTRDIEMVDDWRRKFAAISEFVKNKEQKAEAAICERRCEFRIGELLGPAEPIPGPGRGKPSFVDDGLSRNERHEFRLMAEHREPFEAALADGVTSRRGILRLLREPEPVQTPGFPTGPFRTIVIDPPWPMEKIILDRRPVEKEAMDYSRWTLENIKDDLPISRLANSDGCHIYLWVTHKFLPNGLSLFDAWGVRYECLITWLKPTAQPLWWKFNTEHCLFGKVGTSALLEKGVAVGFTAPQQRHSHKPEEFFDIVRRVSPEPRLTLFDDERSGFKRWGIRHAG